MVHLELTDLATRDTTGAYQAFRCRHQGHHVMFGENFSATLFSDVTARHCNLRGFLWDTSNFPEDLTSPFQTQPCCILDEGVRHLIGYYGRNLVYLTHDGWIWSTDLHTAAAIRHFFLPADWLCANGELIIEVTANGDLIFAKKDELAVIKRDLKSRFEIDPK